MVVYAPLAPDSYLHLGMGKYIFQNRVIPTHEMISYKVVEPALEWVTHGWLGSLFLYVITATNIKIASTAVLISLLLISLYVLFHIYRILEISMDLFFLSLGASFIVLPIFWKLHPSLLLAPLALFLIYSLLRVLKRRDIRFIYFVPIVSLIWANIYGGFLFIFAAILAAYLIFIIYEKIFRRKEIAIGLWTYSFVLVSSFLTSLLNPIGLRVWLYFFSFTGILNIKKSFSSLPGYLTLINQSFLRENISTIPYASGLLILLSLTIGTIYIILVKKYHSILPRIKFMLPLMVLTVIPFWYVRLMPFVVLCLTPYAALFFKYFADKYKNISYIAFSMLSAMLIPIYSAYIVFPMKIVRYEEPVEQLRMIKKLLLPANVLASSEHVGYVFYQMQQKMSIDLFDDIFDESETFDLFVTGDIIDPIRLRNTFYAQRINTIIFDKESGNITRSILETPDNPWALLYFDKNGFLFANRAYIEDEILKKYEIRSIKLSSNLGIDKTEMKGALHELEQLADRYPSNTMVKGQLATLYRIQKMPGKAEKVLLSIPAHEWDYTVLTEMGRIKASAGDCTEAETYFLAALEDRAEQNYSQAVLDLAVVYAGCLGDKAKAAHYFERYLSFVLPQSEKDKARKLAQDFDIELK